MCQVQWRSAKYWSNADANYVLDMQRACHVRGNACPVLVFVNHVSMTNKKSVPFYNSLSRDWEHHVKYASYHNSLSTFQCEAVCAGFSLMNDRVVDMCGDEVLLNTVLETSGMVRYIVSSKPSHR